MDVIEELVDETDKKAEDRNAYDALIAEGGDPFGKAKNVSDVVNASDISGLILQELIKRVDGCDTTFANLVFLQTEEGLKHLHNKIKARDALKDGTGTFRRSGDAETATIDVTVDEFVDSIMHPRTISPDESKAISDFIDTYEIKFQKSIDDQLDNPEGQKFLLKCAKTKDAFGRGDGHFKRG